MNKSEMWDLQASKKILNSGDEIYSEEEIKKISELLFTLAELSVEQFINDQNKRDEKSNCNEQGKL